MPQLKKITRELKTEKDIRSNILMQLFSIFLTIAGPFLLVYLNIRCEKNQCVLLQFPLVLPTHLAAYFSVFSFVVVMLFLLLVLLVSHLSKLELDYRRGKHRISTVTAGLPPSLVGLLLTSMLIICIAYLKPDYIRLVRSEHLRLLCTTVVFCYIFSFVLSVLIKFKYLDQQRNYNPLMGFFHGYNWRVKFGSVDLKYYFYAHAGLVAWALIDLVIFVDVILNRTVTAPVCFIFTTQYALILHTLFYEKFLAERPFIVTEGLGFFWLLRVLLFTPFLISLPLLYTAVTEISMPKPAMLANCALFMFGFVIYVSSLHQKENYVASPIVSRSLKCIVTNSGKRLLAGGYWERVQKPDYLGYMIIWFSWVVACRFSAISVIVLAVIYAGVFFWLYQTDWIHKERYGSAWARYTSIVPHKIIPLIY